MILRRVIEHVRHQEWTAIAIDLVIVVVGVFIGIQVSNWNTEAIERRETQDAMRRLADDMRLSIQLTQDGATFMAQNARYADLVFDRLRNCSLAENERDEFATGLYRLGKVTTARFVRTTFDELRDSGRLGYLRDARLRQALDETARRQDSHEVVFRLIVARTDPHMAYIDSQVIYDIGAAVGGDARIRWNQLDIDFDQACHDRRFLAAVGAVRNYTYDNLTDSNRMQARFAAILALVEKDAAR
jgi:hypothetical protein